MCFHITLSLKCIGVNGNIFPKTENVARFVTSRFRQFKSPRGPGKLPDLATMLPSWQHWNLFAPSAPHENLTRWIPTPHSLPTVNGPWNQNDKAKIRQRSRIRPDSKTSVKSHMETKCATLFKISLDRQTQVCLWRHFCLQSDEIHHNCFLSHCVSFESKAYSHSCIVWVITIFWLTEMV